LGTYVRTGRTENRGYRQGQRIKIGSTEAPTGQQDGSARLGKPAETRKQLARNQKGNIVRRKKRLENFSSTEPYETEIQMSGGA
jgi:hypothetical protein